VRCATNSQQCIYLDSGQEIDNGTVVEKVPQYRMACGHRLVLPSIAAKARLIFGVCDGVQPRFRFLFLCFCGAEIEP